MDYFEKSPEIPVVLISIMTGSLGYLSPTLIVMLSSRWQGLLYRLKLTEACKAYVMEPQFNSAVDPRQSTTCTVSDRLAPSPRLDILCVIPSRWRLLSFRRRPSLPIFPCPLGGLVGRTLWRRSWRYDTIYSLLAWNGYGWLGFAYRILGHCLDNLF